MSFLANLSSIENDALGLSRNRVYFFLDLNIHGAFFVVTFMTIIMGMTLFASEFLTFHIKN